MLVLTRREGERIAIGDSVFITVVSVQGNKVRIGIEAPEKLSIKRGELLETTDAGVSKRELLQQS